MRSFYTLVILALVATSTPVYGQTTPVSSPVPAASPFTAPADWVQLPRGFTLTEIKNVFRGPRKGKNDTGLFVQAVLPIPSGIVAAGLLQLRTFLAKSRNTKITASTKPMKLCGATANVSTVRLGTGKNPAIIETTVLSQRGLTYATLYIRPIAPANAAIESAIRSACPLPGGGLPDMAPPSGWTAVQQGLDFQLGGIWLGNAPVQIMTLLQAKGIPNLDVLAQGAPQTVSSSKMNVKYRVSVQRVKFCGTTGMLVTSQFIVPPGFGMTYSFAAAQGQSGTYLLSYLHPSNYTDAGAQQSLKTLCAGAPLPTPSGSPLPFPAP